MVLPPHCPLLCETLMLASKCFVDGDQDRALTVTAVGPANPWLMGHLWWLWFLKTLTDLEPHWQPWREVWYFMHTVQYIVFTFGSYAWMHMSWALPSHIVSLLSAWHCRCILSTVLKKKQTQNTRLGNGDQKWQSQKWQCWKVTLRITLWDTVILRQQSLQAARYSCRQVSAVQEPGPSVWPPVTRRCRLSGGLRRTCAPALVLQICHMELVRVW